MAKKARAQKRAQREKESPTSKRDSSENAEASVSECDKHVDETMKVNNVRRKITHVTKKIPEMQNKCYELCLTCCELLQGDITSGDSLEVDDIDALLAGEDSKDGGGKVCTVEEHIDQKRSHHVTYRIDKRDVWCYKCGHSVDPQNSTVRSLDQVVTLIHQNLTFLGELRRTTSPQTMQSTPVSVGPAATSRTISKTRQNADQEIAGASGGVTGLINLGNTCFFNAVMQNICRGAGVTQYFSYTRENRVDCVDGFWLTSGIESKDNNTSVNDDSKMGTDSNSRPQRKGKSKANSVGGLVRNYVELDEYPWPIIDTFRTLLSDMNGSSTKGTANPKRLFLELVNIAPNFEGYHQQDSHEALRYLMDGWRTAENERRMQSVPEKLKSKGMRAEELGSFVDTLYGGRTCNTVLCHTCQKSSVMSENFFDLSLPMPKLDYSDSYASAIKTTGSAPRLSKHQKKMAARNERKQNAKGKRANRKKTAAQTHTSTTENAPEADHTVATGNVEENDRVSETNNAAESERPREANRPIDSVQVPEVAQISDTPSTSGTASMSTTLMSAAPTESANSADDDLVGFSSDIAVENIYEGSEDCRRADPVDDAYTGQESKADMSVIETSVIADSLDAIEAAGNIKGKESSKDIAEVTFTNSRGLYSTTVADCRSDKADCEHEVVTVRANMEANAIVNNICRAECNDDDRGSIEFAIKAISSADKSENDHGDTFEDTSMNKKQLTVIESLEVDEGVEMEQSGRDANSATGKIISSTTSGSPDTGGSITGAETCLVDEDGCDRKRKYEQQSRTMHTHNTATDSTPTESQTQAVETSVAQSVASANNTMNEDAPVCISGVDYVVNLPSDTVKEHVSTSTITEQTLRDESGEDVVSTVPVDSVLESMPSDSTYSGEHLTQPDPEAASAPAKNENAAIRPDEANHAVTIKESLDCEDSSPITSDQDISAETTPSKASSSRRQSLPRTARLNPNARISPSAKSSGLGGLSLDACLNALCSPEELVEDNRYQCKTCKSLREATKWLLVDKISRILTVHLKRFEARGKRMSKITDHVDFPLVLDLTQYCSQTCRDPDGKVISQDSAVQYKLTGIVVHDGGNLRGGHYTACLRNKTSTGWTYVSDTHHRAIDESKVLASQASILFYELMS
ncbi:hypothetical protein SARC_02082 [Sphaeroforma arctica JP610]|uniref:USP domain-containing protein n=1 Tax=Sphaeroforma arctica JP610 TaxID=667725 RepID=A0A0L0G9N5_9EUKA|nr:hypothetical protein SARC_02082 [Sphaeroforma arctica JP610]KNC85742.1 hypothetical protein SARC_02082 [Sphaeroforma arctica JP610]|eukprot:XP_014159644.1 hypothetical protein SARC_02082 [Sphaeroforma arctica JP610]